MINGPAMMQMMPQQIQQQMMAPQQQVIDPRAQYERQSQLADMLMQQSQNYVPNSGVAGALAMMANAWAGKRASGKAEGALSKVLEQEAAAKEAEVRQSLEAEAAKRKAEFEDAIKLEAAKQGLKRPDLIAQFEAAGIDPRSPEAQQRILQGTGPQTSVNVNTGERQERFLYGSDAGLPAGWRIDTQTGQASQIPGGPAALEAEQNEKKAAGRESQKAVTQGVMFDEISRALEVIEQNPNMAAGPLSVVGQFLNVGPANKLEGRLEAIKPNIAFERLDQMRQNSPTGGAVGQLSDSEREALSSVMGSLRQTQSPDDLQYNLRRLNNLIIDAQHGNSDQRAELVRSGQVSAEVNDQIESLYMPLEQPKQQQSADPELDNLLQKYLN